MEGALHQSENIAGRFISGRRDEDNISMKIIITTVGWEKKDPELILRNDVLMSQQERT